MKLCCDLALLIVMHAGITESTKLRVSTRTCHALRPAHTYMPKHCCLSAHRDIYAFTGDAFASAAVTGNLCHSVRLFL